MPLNNSGGGGGGAGAIRAGRAFVELFLNDNALYRALDRAAARLKAFGSFLTTVGAGAAGLGAGLLTPLTGLFTAAVERGQEFQRLSERVGDTTENLSGFAAAAGTTGQTLEDLKGHWENLAERVVQAAAGTGEAADTFKKLGIDADKFSLLGPVEQMEALADALNAFSSNDTVRRGLLSSLGGDQFQGLNELFKKGSSGIRALRAEAAKTGQVVGTEEAKQADVAWQALNRTWAAGKGVLLSVGAALLPQAETLAMLTGHLVDAAAMAREFIGENKALVLGAAAAGAGLVAAGAALIALGGAASLAGAALGGLVTLFTGAASAVAFLLSPLGLVTAAVVALGYLFVTQTDAGQGWVAMLAAGFGELADTAKAAFGGVADALRAGDLTLAFKVVTVGLALEWAKVVLFWTETWNRFKGFFVDGWHDAVKLVKLLWTDFEAWFDKLFLGILRTLVTNFGSAVSEMFRLLAGLAKGLKLHEDAANFLRLADAGPKAILGALDNLDSKVEPNRQGRRAAIEKEARDEQAARDKARKADADSARADVDLFRRALAELIGRASSGALFKDVMDGVAAGVARAIPKGATVPTQSQILGRVAVATGMGPLGQQLGVGSSIDKEQLKQTTRAADGIAKVNDTVQALPAAIANNLRIK